jgi:hypothetical protein
MQVSKELPDSRVVRYSTTSLHHANWLQACLALYAPKIFKNYEDGLSSLYKNHPNLSRIFPNSVFPAVGFNLGPDSVCLPHVDASNVSYGLCPITSAGTYNPRKGGHLVLWDLKIVIEFPSGSTIAIPSSILKHSNTKIGEGETRYSMVQFCAGGLLRWVRYGFCSKKSLLATEGGQEKAILIDGIHNENWKVALELLSKAGELEEDRLVLN